MRLPSLKTLWTDFYFSSWYKLATSCLQELSGSIEVYKVDILEGSEIL